MPIRKTLLVSLSLLAFSSAAYADTLFQNVTVIDGTGAPAQHNRNVLVKDGRIAAITDANVELPTDTTIIYAGEHTLLPTLINTHGHVGLLKGDSGAPSHLTDDNIARHLQQYQSYGVSEVLSMGTDHANAFDMRKATAEKRVKGARLFTTGYGFGVENGAPPKAMGIDEVKYPKTADEARQQVRALAANKPDMVKIWVDDFGGTVPKMSPEVYTAIIEEAHANGIRVAAHVYYAEDARNLVANGVDVIAHSIRDMEVDDALIADMRARGVTYIPTLSLDEFAFVYESRPVWMDDKFFKNALEEGTFERIDSAAYREKIKKDPKSAKDAAGLAIALKNLKRIHDGGVRVTLGTDSGALPIRPIGFAEHYELGLMRDAGLTAEQIIAISTQNGAELLGIYDSKGTLEIGKEADLLLVKGDVANDITATRNIVSVWDDGKQVSDGPLRDAALKDKWMP